MRYQNIHQDFKSQFAAECLAYTGKHEHAYNNILYRQYKGSETEIALIAPFLEAETSDIAIIRALISNLEKRDLPASGKLLCYASDVQKLINTYRRETYASIYYSRLLNLLHELCESTHSFRSTLQTELLIKLETLCEYKPGAGSVNKFGKEAIEEYCIELEEYLCNLHIYYHELNTLLEQESDISQHISLLTPVQDYLQNLVNMTEVVLYTTQCTQVALEEWCFCLEVWELQEMYN